MAVTISTSKDLDRIAQGSAFGNVITGVNTLTGSFGKDTGDGAVTVTYTARMRY